MNPFNTSYAQGISGANTTGSSSTVPTFSADIAGAAENQTYLLDFSSNIIILWGINCTYGDISPDYPAGGKCSEAPTYLDASYNSSDNVGTQLVGTFTNKTTSGFVLSGNIWYNVVTIAGVTQYQTIYEATYISQDIYYLGSTTANVTGIIGMGPYSPLWQMYVNTSTFQTTYSV